MKHVPWWSVIFSAFASVTQACDLECQFQRELHEQGLTGAVYALVDGATTRVGAVGVANHATQAKLSPGSRVQVGSVTKTLVALGVLRLASQGRLDLDAPLDRVLTEPVLINPWALRTPVTVRHLLDHTSGLDDLRLRHMFSMRILARAPLRDAFDGPPDLLRVRVEPGSRFSYSNMGYTLAGLVIEAVTGERYESWLDRELLRPLGMNDSTFEFVTQTGEHADARLAWGHHDDYSPAAALPTWVRPAAQFTTTAGDMANLARFLLGDGRIGEEPYIADALWQQSGRARHTQAARAGLEVGYALGLAWRDRHGAAGLCHLGNTVGYRAALCVYPDAQQAHFVAHNMDSETAWYERFEELLVRELDVATPALPAFEGAVDTAEWEGRYVPAPARFESFRYLDLLFGTITLRESSTGIALAGAGSAPRPLIAVGPRLLRVEDRRLASHVLMRDGNDHFISDGTRTWRRIGITTFALAWISLGFGACGLLMLLVLVPWRAWRRGEPWVTPASMAWLLLLLPAPLLATQPFMAIGDVTAASVSLYVVTLALPILMAAHIAWSLRSRARVRSWCVHALAAVLVLQWCASLYAWDLLPLALWR